MQESKEILNVYQTEKSCEYREEIYLVRDNGAVCRNKRPDKRKRPLDGKWTFGNVNKNTGYMHISSQTVHRIVATAFHGKQPTDMHIVDHKDTNRQNNRPENLWWITKLENILLNPITLSKLIYKYGSIQNFFNNPSEPIVGDIDPNFEWMRTVTKEESENTKANLTKWANEGKVSRGGQLGEWIFSTLITDNKAQTKSNELTSSKTKLAKQKNWKTPAEFPNCPDLINETALDSYKQLLVKDSIFSTNQYGTSYIEESGINKVTGDLVVISRSENVKVYAVAKVFIKDEFFIHESLGSFFKIDGAQKVYTIALGLKWEGGETFDDLVG